MLLSCILIGEYKDKRRADWVENNALYNDGEMPRLKAYDFLRNFLYIMNLPSRFWSSDKIWWYINCNTYNSSDKTLMHSEIITNSYFP